MDDSRPNKIPVKITVDPDLLSWIDKQVEKRIYATRTHAFESGIAKLKEIDDIKKGSFQRE